MLVVSATKSGVFETVGVLILFCTAIAEHLCKSITGDNLLFVVCKVNCTNRDLLPVISLASLIGLATIWGVVK